MKLRSFVVTSLRSIYLLLKRIVLSLAKFAINVLDTFCKLISDLSYTLFRFFAELGFKLRLTENSFTSKISD